MWQCAYIWVWGVPFCIDYSVFPILPPPPRMFSHRGCQLRHSAARAARHPHYFTLLEATHFHLHIVSIAHLPGSSQYLVRLFFYPTKVLICTSGFAQKAKAVSPQCGSINCKKYHAQFGNLHKQQHHPPAASCT